MTKDSALFDIGALDAVEKANEGVEVEIRHPITNVGVGVFVKIKGKDSDQYREYIADAIDALNRKEAAAARKGQVLPVRTAEQNLEENVEMLCAMTVGWRTGEKPVLVAKGEELPFSIANAKKVYSNPSYRVIVDQLLEEMGNLENFIQASRSK